MFSWNSLAFSMIQQMLAIWSLVPLPFLNRTCTFESSWLMYCWSLTWRILSNFEILKVKGWAKAHKKIFQSKILILISDNIYINTKTLNEKIIYMNKVYNSQKKISQTQMFLHLLKEHQNLRTSKTSEIGKALITCLSPQKSSRAGKYGYGVSK